MKRKIRYSLLLFPCFLLTSFISGCSFLEDESVDKYVGTYICTTSYEKEMTYYWGSEKEVSSHNLCSVSSILKINKDKTVEYTPGKNQQTSFGKIRVFSDHCKLVDVPGLMDNYKFELKAINSANLKGLTYFYRSKNTGVDYEYQVRNVVFSAYVDPSLYENYVGEYSIEKSEKQTHVRMYNDSNYNAYQGGKGTNYCSLENGKLIVNSDYTGKVIDKNGKEYALSILFIDDRIVLSEIDKENSIFPSSITLGFTSADSVISLYFSCEVDEKNNETYYNRYSYTFGFSKPIDDKFKFLG